VNLGPFFGVDFNLWPTAYIYIYSRYRADTDVKLDQTKPNRAQLIRTGQC